MGLACGMGWWEEICYLFKLEGDSLASSVEGGSLLGGWVSEWFGNVRGIQMHYAIVEIWGVESPLNYCTATIDCSGL